MAVLKDYEIQLYLSLHFIYQKIPCLMCSTQTRETPWDYADLPTGETQKLYSFGSMNKHCYGENCRVFIDKTGN